jgi:hypothetical protein
MTCDQCRGWAATTEEQWANRLDNMNAAPEVKVHTCPACGSDEWATTREFIKTPVYRPSISFVGAAVTAWAAACALGAVLLRGCGGP